MTCETNKQENADENVIGYRNDVSNNDGHSLAAILNIALTRNSDRIVVNMQKYINDSDIYNR